MVLEKTKEVLEQGQEQINGKSLDPPKVRRLEIRLSTDYLPLQKKAQDQEAPR